MIEAPAQALELRPTTGLEHFRDCRCDTDTNPRQ
jgi:hypothetical protein